MHPSWISLTYTEILLFKTFMKLKLIVYTLPKSKIMKVNETGVGVAEWKNSTLKQKGNKGSVKYVMKNIFQIVSTSSPTEIVVLNSLGSFSHFVTQNMSGQHRSPSEQNSLLSLARALMQQKHSAQCCWAQPAILQLSCCTFCREMRTEDCRLICTAVASQHTISLCWLWLACPCPPTSQIIDTGCSERCCRSVELWHWGWWAILLVGAQLD